MLKCAQTRIGINLRVNHSDIIFSEEDTWERISLLAKDIKRNFEVQISQSQLLVMMG